MVSQSEYAQMAVKARQKAAELDEKASKADNVQARKSFKEQADEERAHARNCEELATDRGY